jgi:TatD DNase family protein
MPLPYAVTMYDIHCHIDVIKSTPERVAGLISSGIKPSSWAEHRKLARILSINVSLGFHPFFVTKDSAGDIDLLKTYLDDPAVIALGEIGLDYHKDTASDREAQLTIFKEQLFLASQRGLPVVLHCRKAHDPLFECLAQVELSGVVFHAFSGHEQDHRKAMDRGDYISFGFPITYPDNKKQRAMLSMTPLDRIVLETDAPFMKRIGMEPTTPDDIEYVYASAAQIKGIEVEAMIEIVKENVHRIWPHFKDFQRQSPV